jgi:hypothetical protein
VELLLASSFLLLLLLLLLLETSSGKTKALTQWKPPRDHSGHPLLFSPQKPSGWSTPPPPPRRRAAFDNGPGLQHVFMAKTIIIIEVRRTRPKYLSSRYNH